ncbi:hypothetical protein CAL29_24025 [Bordetella genomosp. 10]|uniref:Carboxylic ester hydrolase n=1 Tax=Bordetella genomosp. 10 TaxID=1416804 RepID=A0A261S0Z3_9BORD|nr:carboxylesterase family protein [Bordetella genomosp. 10]OZI31019.1 hypothetical protein CAL29_24025 [Bordetella genomosp. 10]
MRDNDRHEGMPIVETAHGSLQGSRRGDVAIFKGIRYGAPTGGGNRFRPPQPVAAWSGVRAATVFGPSAPQAPTAPDALRSWYFDIEPVSEDCLFLNVFTAALGSRKPRPVMVWLHGGSWAACAGTAPGFDGTNLACLGDVVVVTVNHRLNVFGYLALPELGPEFADSGNAGVLDMGAALCWVRDNIAAFGGDPDNVTIFGQSGGAAKVAALMNAPAMRGLFHKAIIQSCSGGLRLVEPGQAARTTAALAARLGIDKADAGAWQSVPMNTLIAATRSSANAYRPVLDSRTFTVHPYDPVATPVSPRIPLLVGNTTTESTFFLAADRNNFTIEMAEVTARVARFLNITPENGQHIVDVYRSLLPPDRNAFHVLAQIVTDYMYRRNTMRIACLKARQAGPVYAYVFDWKTPVLGGILLSPHTSEVPFVFGTTAQAAGMVGNGADLPRITHTVMSAWASFAHTGRPASTTLPAWAAYTEQAGLAMVINDRSRVAEDPDGAQRHVFDELPFFDYDMPQNFAQA